MEKYYSASALAGLCSVNVEKAADYFNVSTRRIRQLLIDGRLSGVKRGKAWQVAYPYQFTIGTRGPHLLLQQAKGSNVRPFRSKRKRNN